MQGQELERAGALGNAALPNCPGGPLILTEPDSEALDAILNLWSSLATGACHGRIVLAAPGIYRLTSEVCRGKSVAPEPRCSR